MLYIIHVISPYLEELSDHSSILSKKIIKTGKLLQHSTNWQMEEFQNRIKEFIII